MFGLVIISWSIKLLNMLLKVESFFWLSRKIVKLPRVQCSFHHDHSTDSNLAENKAQSLKGIVDEFYIRLTCASTPSFHVSSVVSSRWAEWLSWVEATSRIQDTSEAPKDESQSKLWKSHSYLSGILETISFHLGLEIIKQGNYKLLISIPSLQA